MKKIEIFRIESLSRAPLVVEGYLFEGSNPKAESVAIVGAMEGTNILPLYTASKLVDFLRHVISDEKKIRGDILIIPSINHYALNINAHYWPLDKTDINVMFPGYDQGETTQRIAKYLFDALQGYTYGISLETRQGMVSCIPFVRLFESGYEDIKGAKAFGYPFIHHATLRSIDTVSLQYNLQLWGTKAYSVMCPTQTQIDYHGSNEIFDGIVRFLSKKKIIQYKTYAGFESALVSKDDIQLMKSPKSGIFVPTKPVGAHVVKDEMIGKIIHSLEGEVIHRFFAPSDGLIGCIYQNALILENASAFRIITVG